MHCCKLLDHIVKLANICQKIVTFTLFPFNNYSGHINESYYCTTGYCWQQEMASQLETRKMNIVTFVCDDHMEPTAAVLLKQFSSHVVAGFS